LSIGSSARQQQNASAKENLLPTVTYAKPKATKKTKATATKALTAALTKASKDKKNRTATLTFTEIPINVPKNNMAPAVPERRRRKVSTHAFSLSLFKENEQPRSPGVSFSPK